MRKTYYYHPPTKLREGNVFRSSCHSVHGWGGGRRSPLWRETSPRTQIPLDRDTYPQTQTPWTEIPADWQLVAATEAGGTHPTGIHTCLTPWKRKKLLILTRLILVLLKNSECSSSKAPPPPPGSANAMPYWLSTSSKLLWMCRRHRI